MSLTFALQALLVRHESYIAGAEEERRQMATIIDQLEIEKRGLEVANERTIEENRDLLDQLEHMNHAITSSDAYIHSLATTLKSNRNEIRRLAALATRSTELEAQLLAIETEQIQLQDELESTQFDQRSAVHRWKDAERTISSLQEQVDKIEKEANEERERHEEIVARFERRRAVELELENSAMRSKRTAQPAALQEEIGSNVVSHFVRDILQDNANLQMGIVELREMLMGSNEEVENLREQMLLHQPTIPFNKPNSALKSELARTGAPDAMPEVHVHHHYHPPSMAKSAIREKPSIARWPRYRRNAATNRLLSPPSGLRTPTIPNEQHIIIASSPSSAAAILSQTSVTIPPYQPPRPSRWSMQSSQNSSSIAPSSVPSSPRSVFRNPSIFDTIDTTMDSSRPTSPESIGAESPIFFSRRKRAGSDASLASLSASVAAETYSAASQHLTYLPETTNKNQILNTSNNATIVRSIILEEREEDLLPDKPTLRSNSNTSINGVFSPSVLIRPRLQRAKSHESMLSIRHATETNSLRSKPSQLLAHNISSSRTPISISTPAIDPTFAVAQPAPFRSIRVSSSTYNRSLLSGRSPLFNDNTVSPTHHQRNSASLPAVEKKPPPLTKRVGGWMAGKWGIAPMASTANSRSKARVIERATGVNQQGIIRGLVAGIDTRERFNVEAVDVDISALRESLRDV